MLPKTRISTTQDDGRAWIAGGLTDAVSSTTKIPSEAHLRFLRCGTVLLTVGEVPS